jgi:uncharacterized protein
MDPHPVPPPIWGREKGRGPGIWNLECNHMRVLIIGATGFIGKELVIELRENGHQPVAVSRNSAKAAEILGKGTEILEWKGMSANDLAQKLNGFEAIVNLAGENLAAGRWTEHRKKLLTDSRINTGQLLAGAIRLSSSRPSVLLQGSAIGIYGTQVNQVADETSPPGTGFIASLTAEWESSVISLNDIVPRIILIRTGLVLGKNGGLLERILLPFRFYSGAILGPGSQMMSWIHLKDEVRAIRFLIENTQCSGPYNLAAPSPVTMKSFVKALAKITSKPAWLKVPSWALKAALGQMAEETILASQVIYPGRLLQEGFRFEYDQLEPALINLLSE